MLTVLTGHVSPDTAYVVDDYPYGFRLRCKIRYWLETNPKHGMRLVSQTTNPKRPGEVWNKPKASTYSSALVMGLDENGHVQSTGLGTWATDEQIDAFATAYAAAITPYIEATMKRMKLMNRAASKITFTCTTVTPETPRQSEEEQRQIWGRAVAAAKREIGE